MSEYTPNTVVEFSVDTTKEKFKLSDLGIDFDTLGKQLNPHIAEQIDGSLKMWWIKNTCPSWEIVERGKKMNEKYVLEKPASKDVLKTLNDRELPDYDRIALATNNIFNDTFELSEIKDWVDAVASGNKIVNPLSPKEELLMEYKSIEKPESNFRSGFNLGIEEAVEIIAKEHPDVADWLKGSDKDD